MSITDELRKWGYGFCGDTHDVVNAIADRIDAEHEEAIQQALMGEGGVPATDENMAEHGWVRLPVDGEAPSKQLADWIERRGLVTGPLDADGELWHSGDMSDSNWGAIEGIVYGNGRWLVRGHDTSALWIPADSIRHYHAPTVEDVLREFGDWYAHTKGGCDEDGIIAEYAAKLRLAEEYA